MFANHLRAPYYVFFIKKHPTILLRYTIPVRWQERYLKSILHIVRCPSGVSSYRTGTGQLIPSDHPMSSANFLATYACSSIVMMIPSVRRSNRYNIEASLVLYSLFFMVMKKVQLQLTCTCKNKKKRCVIYASCM